MLVEYYDEARTELYNLGRDISQQRDMAAEYSGRAAKMRAALTTWRRDVNAQVNMPNPRFDPAKYRELYIDVDASRFDPLKADSVEWERIWQWRKKMDAVLPEER